MSAPLWTTPPGDLGTIVEAEFYQVQLDATNATNYEHISGNLPDGIRITIYGKCEGYPNSKDFIQGVPSEVAYNVTSRFVVRATSADGSVADRVFQLTVTGNDAPTIDTLPSSDLGAIWDGQYFSQQLTAFDPDPGDTLTWKIQSGNLPAGLSISASGLISGYIEPTPLLTGTPGYDVNKFDIGSFDFSTVAESKTFEWVAQVTDGKEIAIKNYTLFVASRNTATSDTDAITADSFQNTALFNTVDYLTDASSSTERPPALLTKSTDFGVIKHDNFFAHQFVGYDPDGDPMQFSLSVGNAQGFDVDDANFDMVAFDKGLLELPPGLVLDIDTGWLHGYIPQINATTKNYDFSVQTYKTNKPSITSARVPFKLTVEGDIDKTIVWPSSNLGTINTGDISELDVIAEIKSGRQVQYELRSGAKDGSLGEGKLPQGLKITTDGYLQGRVSFEHIMFDNGLTTFDIEMKDKGELSAITTFERTFKFTVRAYSSDGVIDTYNQFTLSLVPETFDPYETLYIRALPNQTQRDIFSSLVNNSDDIPTDDIYRKSDFYFGLQQDVRALIATGLNPKTVSAYIQATAKNHFNNVLKFGDIKVATSYDENNVAKYDVVYIELIDNEVGTDPVTKNATPASDTINLQVQQSISNMFDLVKPITIDSSWPKASTGIQSSDQGNEIEVYPNAIQNMRNRMTEIIGSTILERFVLPDWMQDKQKDGIVKGWTLAAPIVYMKPGTGERTAYRLKERTQFDLKNISFEVDRFILDNNLSNFYDKQLSKFNATAETAFDASEIAQVSAATVDYSIASADFDTLNKRLASQVVDSGAIAGVNDVTQLDGKTVIWITHEGMTDHDNDNDGWNEQLDTFDATGVGFEGENSGIGGFDRGQGIPGYADKLTGNATINKQAGVWTISVNSDSVVTFTFTKEIDNGQQVAVTYDNITYYYERNAVQGSPRYVNVNSINLTNDGVTTTFDGKDTRFFAGVDTHTTLDQNDAWLKFPRVDAFSNYANRT
jgi:hypothetical protein